MKRRYLIGAAAIAAAGLGGFLWWNAAALPADTLSREVGRLAGLTVRAQGGATVSLLPHPRLKLADAVLTDAAGRTIVRAELIQANLDIGSLLSGRARIDDLRIVGGEVMLAVDGGGRSGMDTLIGRLDGGGTGVGVAGAIRLSQTDIIYSDARYGLAGRIDDASAVLTLPTEREALGLVLTGRWRDEAVDLRATWPGSALRAAGGAKASASLRSSRGRVDLAGSATGAETPSFQGSLSLAMASGAKVAEWTGIEGPLLDRLSDVSLNGPVTINSRSVSMPSAAITMGENRLDGALMLRTDQMRPVLSGTLAAQVLDVGAFLPDGRRLKSAQGWTAQPFDWTAMTRADLDLRVSATQARIGSLVLGQAAFGVILKAGKLEVSLGRSDVGSGTLRGRVALGPGPAGLDLRLQANVEQADAAALLAPLLPARPLSGRATGQVQLEAAGHSMATLVAASSGRGGLSVRRGELAGISAADVLKLADRSPPPVALEWRGGRSAFEAASFPFVLRRGTIEIADGTLAGSAFKATVAGTIDLQGMTLDLSAGLAPATGPARGPLVFAMTGPVASPQIALDVRTLLDRTLRASPVKFD